MHLGERIREARKRADLSQFGLAQDLKLSQALISQLENGRPKNASDDTVKRICARLGVELTAADLLELRAARAVGSALFLMYCQNEGCQHAVPAHNGKRWYLIPHGARVRDPHREHACPFCGESLAHVCNEAGCNAPVVHAAGWCPRGHAVVAIERMDPMLPYDDPGWQARCRDAERHINTLLRRAQVETLLLGPAGTMPTAAAGDRFGAGLDDDAETQLAQGAE